jgi:hypothetical protein
MNLKELFELVRELSNRGFWGKLEIEFKNGKPYLGVRSEKILFDQPMSGGIKGLK